MDDWKTGRTVKITCWADPVAWPLILRNKMRCTINRSTTQHPSNGRCNIPGPFLSVQTGLKSQPVSKSRSSCTMTMMWMLNKRFVHRTYGPLFACLSFFLFCKLPPPAILQVFATLRIIVSIRHADFNWMTHIIFITSRLDDDLWDLWAWQKCK